MDKKDSTTLKIDDTTLKGMVQRRAQAAKAHWEGKYNLSQVRKKNEALYDTSYIKERVIDDRYEDIFADNRMFTAVRTILPFITNRITQPEVMPNDADGDDIDDMLAVEFAKDFEAILVRQAEKVKAKAKIKLAVQDLLAGKRVGVLMWRYNAQKNCLELEHIDPECVLIDHTVKLHEEPNFVQRWNDRSLGDIIRQFPNKKDELFSKYGIAKGVNSQLEKTYKVTETWMKYDDGDKSQIIVVWMEGETVLGKISDPTWMEARKNLIEYPMMPFVFFNFLNDGKGWIDNTSFIEQAQYSQMNYDKVGQRIVEDAQYGGIGVPVFAKGALKQGEAAKVRFSPIQRVLLESDDVNKAFTTWQSSPLPQFMIEDKYDNRNNVDNTFGTPNVFRGEQSSNNTASQDIIVRDQAEGRQSELVESIDNAMDRFYNLEGQFIYRYYDEDKYFKVKGDDGKFVNLVINQEKIAENLGIEISIKSGSSLPVDRSQKRATVLKIADRLPTITLYKELGIDNPEETYKQYLLEQTSPQTLVDEADKNIYSKEAYEDLQLVIGDEIPEERDDISPTYMNFLTSYLETDKFAKLDTETQARVSQFIQGIVDKGKRKLVKLALQTQANPMPGVPVGQPQMQLPFGQSQQPQPATEAPQAPNPQPALAGAMPPQM